MIVYLDTSALIKAYVTEAGTERVLAVMRQAEAVASHLIAYVEAHAAFARLAREDVLDDAAHDRVRREFRADWSHYVQVGLSDALADRAAELVEGLGLRACDSLHFAAADYLHRHGDEAVRFACFDRRLNRAAQALGFMLAMPD